MDEMKNQFSDAGSDAEDVNINSDSDTKNESISATDNSSDAPKVTDFSGESAISDNFEPEQINLFDTSFSSEILPEESNNTTDSSFEAVDGTNDASASSSEDEISSEDLSYVDSDTSEEKDVLEGQIEIDFDAEESAKTKTEESKDCGCKKKGYDPDNPRRIDTVFDFVELFIFALVAVLVFTTFFFRHSVVEGSSMENTLHEGEHLIISSLFYTPQRGDIVVCEDYSTPHKKPIVKRIIGIEGDHVQVTRNGKVTLNGEVIEEEYVFVNGIVYENPVDIIVGEGEIFVMGDHRNMSDDSRSFGPINEDSVIGKVLIRFYPFDKFGSVE